MTSPDSFVDDSPLTQLTRVLLHRVVRCFCVSDLELETRRIVAAHELHCVPSRLTGLADKLTRSVFRALAANEAPSASTFQLLLFLQEDSQQFDVIRPIKIQAGLFQYLVGGLVQDEEHATVIVAHNRSQTTPCRADRKPPGT